MTSWTCLCGSSNGDDKTICLSCGRGKRALADNLCRTPEDAWRAGWEAPCEHGLEPTACERCRLRPAEIARLTVLLSGLAREAVPEQAAVA